MPLDTVYVKLTVRERGVREGMAVEGLSRCETRMVDSWEHRISDSECQPTGSYTLRVQDVTRVKGF